MHHSASTGVKGRSRSSDLSSRLEIETSEQLRGAGEDLSEEGLEEEKEGGFLIFPAENVEDRELLVLRIRRSRKGVLHSSEPKIEDGRIIRRM